MRKLEQRTKSPTTIHTKKSRFHVFWTTFTVRVAAMANYQIQDIQLIFFWQQCTKQPGQKWPLDFHSTQKMFPFPSNTFASPWIYWWICYDLCGWKPCTCCKVAFIWLFFCQCPLKKCPEFISVWKPWWIDCIYHLQITNCFTDCQPTPYSQ